MPRIEFDGEGLPIPKIALPPFGSDSDLPTTVLTFTENADFSVFDYRNLGFTHFEAWCVGAAGGRGGDATSQVGYAAEEVMRPVPLNVWNMVLETVVYDDYVQQDLMYNYYRFFYLEYLAGRPGGQNNWWAADATPPQLNKIYPADWSRDSERRHQIENSYALQGMPLPSNWQSTAGQAHSTANPSHLMRFTTYKQVFLNPSDEAMGGGGGGGGFHKVAGALADLDDVVQIVIGKVGIDADYGQVHQNGEWTPDAGVPVNNPLPAGSPIISSTPIAVAQTRAAAVGVYLDNYVKSYPLPRTSFLNPQAGGAGGGSSFADVAQASGGEGGFPGMVWDGSKFIIKGDGGHGGIGGRILPGGGAAGSVAEGVNGSDGIWIPETGIGSGGGGGKGGRAPTGGGGGFFGGTPTNHLSTAGGQGSYSFADTSVYGARQFRQAWSYLQPIIGYDSVTGMSTGLVTFIPRTSTELIIPGTGGGARPFPNMKYGGRGVGFSPDGIVVVRLTKIT